METKDKKEINEKELEDVDGGFNGRRPSGTWVPVDEECKFTYYKTCPFYPRDRRYDNCPTCKHLNDE